jgi:predicted lipoprotein
MRIIKIFGALLLLSFVAYHSVYFKKLDEVKAARLSTEFNAKTYATKFWNDKLVPHLRNAIELSALFSMLTTDKEGSFNKYSNALGIGNIRFFLVKGTGRVVTINEDNIMVQLQSDSAASVISIATEFVFGNAVRDASGLIDINEFKNTMDFNEVSAELNKSIRENVLPGFKQGLTVGTSIEFYGAMELNKNHMNLNRVELIPIEIKKLL